MSLTSGSRLGPYEIVGPLGAGGMGDVYRARDTRLDRTVALKIVRAAFSERFEREARSISALNHPHICTLHDVGTEAGMSYLVMEYVDGAPIAGPLPLADVLRLGIQICEALDAAHKKGIVHRDLKPANILATKAGIKLLDFGLAKLQATADVASVAGEQATVAALTGAHTIVGTPQYMAPEQIEGRAADARTDIFALGCVLYELITGTRAFDGKTASNVMAAVMATEPRRICELVPVTPPALEWVVLRCLEKDPDARWQSAHDVALQLKWVADRPAQTGLTGAPPTRRSLLTGVAIGALAATVAAGAWMWRAGPPRTTPSAPRVSLTIPLPDKVSLTESLLQRSLALSPDGSTIAFSGTEGDGRTAIFLRPIDRFEAIKIAGTEDGLGPFFSPTGQWIGFYANGRLMKIPVTGGVPLPICDAPGFRGSVWLDDDTIVFSARATGPLLRVAADGGAPTQLTTLDAARHEKTHRRPIGLPGGKAIVFTAGSNEIGTYDDARIVALTLATGKITELATGYAPAFSSTGHLLYVRNGAVMAVPFDPDTLKVGTSPVQALKDVVSQPNWGTADYALSANGVLIFAPGSNRTALSEVQWADRKGNLQPIKAPLLAYGTIDVSPDGRRLALGVVGANNVIWTYDLERDQLKRLTFRLDVDSAIWEHDSSRVTYWSGMDLRSIASDGTTEEVLFPASLAGARQVFPRSWSRDGEKLGVTVLTPGEPADVAVFTRADKQLHMVANSRFAEQGGTLSPDGRWIAYTSDKEGRDDVYVRSADGTGAEHKASNEGGGSPHWIRNGRALLYGALPGKWIVSFTPGAAPAFGPRELMFTGLRGKNIVGTAAAPDGQRLAVLVERPLPPITQIRVVTNWARDLAALWN